MATPIAATTTSGLNIAVDAVSASNPSPSTNGHLTNATPMSTTPTLQNKKYEVADIEELPDSPPPSDLSAQSSTDNVTKEAVLNHHGDLQEYHFTSNSAAPPTQYGRLPFAPQHFVPNQLESYSESHLQAVGGALPSLDMYYSATPEPGTEHMYPQACSNLFHPYPANSRQGSVSLGGMQQSGGPAYQMHHDLRVGSTSSITRHPSVPNMPTLASQQGGGAPADHPQRNYHTTSALYEHQYPSILPEGYSQYHHSQAIPTTVAMRTSNAQTTSHHPPVSQPSSTFSHTQAPPPPRPQGLPNLPTFADVPQPDLLAKAFMVFLHAMGGVFRDPAFGPLLDTLENHFGPFTSNSTSLHSNTGLSESGIRTRQDSSSPPPTTAHGQQKEERTVLMCRTPEKLQDEGGSDHTHRTKDLASTCETPEKQSQEELDEDRKTFNEQMQL